jgi:formamidopyrimidine-DNA glycosylase
VPELPDIVLYIEALQTRILGQSVVRVRIAAPFLLRSVTPPPASAEGKTVVALRRLGKRICIGVEGDLWLVLHLMIAGRLHWYERQAGRPASKVLAAIELSNGVLTLTEAGSKRRASLHVVEGEAGLRALDPGGEDVLAMTEDRFGAILQSASHTLKRALTDPRLFSGIGNAYSDEILFAAGLSPLKLTQALTRDEIGRLFDATRAELTKWVAALREEYGPAFPEKVTAFRPGMAVHGKYREPCPRCGTKIQRIRYAANETDYCPACQTGGRLLADRALSRLLREDWPRTIEELEAPALSLTRSGPGRSGRWR